MVDTSDLKFAKTGLIQSREGKIESYYNVNFVKDIIGTGRSSTVVKAVTREGNHPRAIKVLRKERVNDKEKFKNEIEILKRLDHPNILKIYETFEDSRNVYLITELCKGGEVFDRIVNKGHLTESEARKVFTQMIRAVNYCHANGVCYRDLKPENFMYVDESDDSHIKLIDFGCAQVFAEKGSPKNTEKQMMTTRVGTAYYIAPEVLEGCYDESCDIWSAGIILYILLCGYPPFNGTSDADVFESIKLGSYSLDNAEWEGVSDSAKDLIKHMICPSKLRFTAEEVLKHSWMQQEENKDEKPLKLNFQSLKNFNGAQKLKKVAMTVIASQMSEEEIQTLAEQFNKLDKDKDGVLTFEELQAGFSELEGQSKAEIKAFMDSIDTDKSGSIAYTEFIAATMERSAYMKESKLLEAFKKLDKDGNGKITAKELSDALGGDPALKREKEYYEKIIQEADLNGDGVIDYREFIAMMKKVD